jgi:hypothetical protein
MFSIAFLFSLAGLTSISCTPDKVTLCCGKPGYATVRLRVDPATGGVKITALGIDAAAVWVDMNPQFDGAGDYQSHHNDHGETNAGGYLDIKVGCKEEEKAPCDLTRTVTFDVDTEGPVACSVTISCVECGKIRNEKMAPQVTELDRQGDRELERGQLYTAYDLYVQAHAAAEGAGDEETARKIREKIDRVKKLIYKLINDAWKTF